MVVRLTQQEKKTSRTLLWGSYRPHHGGRR